MCAIVSAEKLIAKSCYHLSGRDPCSVCDACRVAMHDYTNSRSCSAFHHACYVPRQATRYALARSDGERRSCEEHVGGDTRYMHGGTRRGPRVARAWRGLVGSGGGQSLRHVLLLWRKRSSRCTALSPACRTRSMRQLLFRHAGQARQVPRNRRQALSQARQLPRCHARGAWGG